MKEVKIHIAPASINCLEKIAMEATVEEIIEHLNKLTDYIKVQEQKIDRLTDIVYELAPIEGKKELLQPYTNRNEGYMLE